MLLSASSSMQLAKTNPAKPIKLLKENNRRLRFLNEDEINRLLSSCDGYLKSIVLIALNTGMRKGEIFNLKWQDIDIDLKIIHVSNSKNSETEGHRHLYGHHADFIKIPNVCKPA